MTLGEKIKEARIACGLTQKQLVGDYITRNMLSKIENDSATPSVRTLEYIASRLALPAGYFMNGGYSDGRSPDGLDEMRSAYKAGKYVECIRLLESAREVATTDEGYLLHARAALAAAKQALTEGDAVKAQEYADAADYYNKEGMYYSAEIDAEMSLILAECALKTDISEFETNAREFERANREIDFSLRYAMARAEYLLKTGETELAGRLLQQRDRKEMESDARYQYLMGVFYLQSGEGKRAEESLRRAEEQAEKQPMLLTEIYRQLEACYLAMEDYKRAHQYASLQIARKQPNIEP